MTTTPTTPDTHADRRLFHVTIVTPEALALETDVLSVTFPAHDGMVGILTHRAPLLTKLGTGVLLLDSPTSTQKFVISGGYAQMKDNALTILTDEAIAAAEITPERIAAETAKLAALKPATEPHAKAQARLTALRQAAQ